MSAPLSLEARMLRDTPELAERLNHDLRYDARVSARTSELAVAIALEALPAGTHVVHVATEDLSAEEGPHSWHVAVWFGGRFGRAGA
jgi:hypothetical protein